MKDLVKYFLYKRVLSCFTLALIFSLLVCCITMTFSLLNFGVSFADITGNHEYKIANPITIVSFAATFVTISLTIIGFALNSFSKRKQSEKNNSILGNSVYEEAVGILLVRYRRKSETLLFINVFNYPLLAKAFTLVLLLGCMFVHCFVGNYRVFYLIVYASLMFCIIVSMLISVFEIYSDVNYTTFRACRIISMKISNRLKYLSKTNSAPSDGFLRPVLRRYARTDVFRSIIFLHKALDQVLYKPAIYGTTLVKNKKELHLFAELALCSDSSIEMMRGTIDDTSLSEDENKNRLKEIDSAFEFFYTQSIKYITSLKDDLKDEIDFIC